MYWCNDCDHGFGEPVENDEGELACPYCQSPWYRDLEGEADALYDRMKDEGKIT